MILGWCFEDKCVEMYYWGKMFGFVYFYNGQEVVSIGVIGVMKWQYDWFCSIYCDYVYVLSVGVLVCEVMSEFFGKEIGCSKGCGGLMYLFFKEYYFFGGFVFIVEGIFVVLGFVFISCYKCDVFGDVFSNVVIVVFFGDGICNNGQFFECMNMVQLWKLLIIFVVENNKWVIGMVYDWVISDLEIWCKVSFFGMVGEEVDGMDVLVVWVVV